MEKGEILLSLIQDFNEFIYPECVRRKALLGKVVEVRDGKVWWLLSSGATATTALTSHKKYRIGDICYMVGINSPSYFSKLFLKQFGMTPKDFEKQYQSGKQIIITQEIKNVEAGEGTK